MAAPTADDIESGGKENPYDGQGFGAVGPISGRGSPPRRRHVWRQAGRYRPGRSTAAASPGEWLASDLARGLAPRVRADGPAPL